MFRGKRKREREDQGPERRRHQCGSLTCLDRKDDAGSDEGKRVSMRINFNNKTRIMN